MNILRTSSRREGINQFSGRGKKIVHPVCVHMRTFRSRATGRNRLIPGIPAINFLYFEKRKQTRNPRGAFAERRKLSSASEPSDLLERVTTLFDDVKNSAPFMGKVWDILHRLPRIDAGDCRAVRVGTELSCRVWRKFGGSGNVASGIPGTFQRLRPEAQF